MTTVPGPWNVTVMLAAAALPKPGAAKVMVAPLLTVVTVVPCRTRTVNGKAWAEAVVASRKQAAAQAKPANREGCRKVIVSVNLWSAKSGSARNQSDRVA